MPDDTLLCWQTRTTVREVKDWLRSNDAAAIASFLWNRFEERYFGPFKPLTILEGNGFMIMAACCLVIEALEAFRQGWESTDGKSRDAFRSFFDRETEFHVFKGYAQPFYTHVRCGILHHAETTGGWTTTLMPGKPMFEPRELRIQADEFREALARSLKAYTSALATSGPTDEIWKELRG
jgi:hypothetical protein